MGLGANSPGVTSLLLRLTGRVPLCSCRLPGPPDALPPLLPVKLPVPLVDVETRAHGEDYDDCPHEDCGHQHGEDRVTVNFSLLFFLRSEEVLI